MFYGRGAGKLPTASAVAADVVDIVKHLHRNIWISWSSHKLELLSAGEVENRFFVRVKGEAAEKKDAVSALFGKVEFFDAGLPGEFGFLTIPMKEKDFAKNYEKLEDAISRIRVA